jgi:hypothetical protein
VVRITAEPRSEILRWAETTPSELGLALAPLVAGPTVRLSGAKETGPGPAPRAPAAPAEKGGLPWRRVRRKLISVAPQRPALLSRIGPLWKHWPEQGVLLFLDVKPV